MSVTENLRSTPTTVPSAQNRIVGVLSLLFFGFVGYGVWDSGYHFWGGLVIALAVIIGGFMAVTGKGEEHATCPLCGQVFVLASRKYNRCPWCLAYSALQDKRAWEIAEDRVEPTPEFLMPLPKDLRFPPLCCACGEPASGARQFTLRYTLRHAMLPTQKQVTYSIDFPYCEPHGRAAESEADFHPKSDLDARAKSAKASLSQFPGIKVSSYRFYREFLRLNGIKSQFEPELSL